MTAKTDPTQATEPIFPFGAEWVRADFHLHTIKEPGASRKTYRDEFRGKENDFPAAFIQQLKTEAIRIGVITNHNHFDLGEYRCLAKRAWKEDILLLPGIELGIRGGGSTIHTLVAFDPKSLSEENNFIRSFLTGQFPRNGQSEGDATEDDLVGCFKKLEALNVPYFVIFAHVDSDNGLLKICKKTELEPQYRQIANIWHDRVLGFQACRSDDKWIVDKLPEGMPIPAKVHGSDPANAITEVGRKDRGLSYLKVSDLSFHSVQFALKDHPLRVREEEPAPTNRPYIQTIEIQGGVLEYSATRFSPELNTLVGSRGSGKSLTIESLRWCLGREAGKGDQAYKKGLIDTFLKKGATVTVNGRDAHGAKVTITRAYTEKTNPAPPIVYIDGTQSQLPIDRVFPGLLYFGQKDLVEREDEFTSQFFSQILGTHPAELDDRERRARASFEKAIDAYQIAIKSKSEDDEHSYEQASLKKQLDAFKEHGVEDQLKEITTFDQDLRRFNNLLTRYQEALVSSADSLSSWDSVDLSAGLLESEANKQLVAELAQLQEEHASGLSSIRSGHASLTSVKTKLDAIAKKLEAKRGELQQAFAKILQEIKAPDLDIDAYRKMVSRHQQLVEIRKLTAERGGKIQLFTTDMIATGDTWLASRKAITEVYALRVNTLNESLPETLRIAIQFQGDRDDFKTFLESIFRGSRFDDGSYGKLLEACDNGLDLFKRREQIISTELSQRMGEIFTEKLNQRLKDILTFSPKDKKSILFDDTSIRELSLGKRAMALLLLLLSLDKHPIIILDQPEDDLDNETIHKLVVDPLAKRKGFTQFIIATHNPNIPVLGDAEQVIACYEDKKEAYRQETGSLDFQETKDAIIKIMEGGKTAFDKRHDIYSLWKK